MNYELSKVSRGIRNNNPLNIRRNPANQWQGLRPVQADKLFCQFKAMKWGLRAAIKLLDNYIKKGAQTPRQIITRWAPPAENETESYVRHACQRAGLAPDSPVLIWNDLRKLIKAMAWIESRYNPSDGELEEARALAERPSPNPGPELSSQSLTPNLRLPCGRQSLRSIGRLPSKEGRGLRAEGDVNGARSRLMRKTYNRNRKGRFAQNSSTSEAAGPSENKNLSLKLLALPLATRHIRADSLHLQMHSCLKKK